ncbi:MAG: PilN domain-containing protein [Armatimonadetes bacterium]|nr:PilN domain-containing protein [Armatimonadota bacterium]
MSRKAASPIHIEWIPGHVRAVDIHTGQSREGSSLSELGSALQKHRKVLVGVGRSLVFLKAVRLPKASPEDLRRIASVQLARLFPLPPDQLAFDIFQTSDRDVEGVLTLVAAMRSEDLKQLRSELQQAGLTASRILPVSLGSPSAAERAGLKDALLVRTTPAGPALDVVQGGILRFSRVAPRDSEPETEIQRTLAAARAENLSLLTDGELSLPGALKAVESDLMLLHHAPPFHFELSEDRAQEAKRQTAMRTRLATVLLIAAALMAVLKWSEQREAAQMARRGAVTWNRKLTRLRSIREAEIARAQRASAVQSALQTAFRPAQPLSDLMAAVGDSLPQGAWCTGLNIERGKAIQVRGTARSSAEVARFVFALGSSPRFRDARLMFANSARIEETPVVQFQVAALGVGNLPMPAPPKKGKKAKTSGKVAKDGTGNRASGEAPPAGSEGLQ